MTFVRPQRSLCAPLAFGLVALCLLPTRALAHPGPDGEVEHHHNEVESKPKAEDAWQPARVGQQIYKNGRVATKADSTATVGMRDDSTVSLRQNTLLIIYGHHAERNKKIIAMEATLETGALRSRLGELSGGHRATISTPSSSTSQEGGETLIKVDEEGTSRVHNHGDGKVTVRGTDAGRVKLAKSTGSKVKRGKRPEKAKALPPTPTWKEGPHEFLGLAGHLGTITGAWNPVEGAASYFVEVATDAGGVNVIASVLVPANVDRFEIRGLLPGTYHVRVAAVDDDHFESLPSPPYASALVGVEVANAPGAEMSWRADEAGNELPVFTGGGLVKLPPGYRCAFGGTETGGDATVTTAELQAPQCLGPDGTVVVGFAFSVEHPVVTLIDEGEIQTVRGRESRHVIRLAGDHSVESLHLDLPKGFELIELAKREDGEFELTLRALPDAGDRDQVVVHLGDAQGPRLGELAVVSTTEVVEVPQPRRAPERHMLEVGVGGFGAWMNDDHGLFDIALGHRPFAGPVGGGTLSVGYFPLRWAGVELDSRLGSGRGGDSRGTFWALRGQVVGQLPFRVTPTAQLGFDLFGVRSGTDFVGNDTDYGFHWGVGGKAFINRRVALTLGLNHLVYESLGSGQTSHLELYGGVRVVFGRESAGRRAK